MCLDFASVSSLYIVPIRKFMQIWYRDILAILRELALRYVSPATQSVPPKIEIEGLRVYHQ